MWRLNVVLVVAAILQALGGECANIPESQSDAAEDGLTFPKQALGPVTFPELAPRASSRIVSGWEATEGQFPFILCLRCIGNSLMQVGAGQVSACGASIIHNRWALTAAHCTARRSLCIVRVGTLSVTRPHLIFESREFFNNPQFLDATPNVVQHHDIGLIKFPFPVEYNNVIQPIRIQRFADRNRNYFDEQLVAAGWGLLWSNGGFPDVLNWVYLRGETNEQCYEDMTTINAGHVVVESTICARGWNDTTQSICGGDSGGPLLITEEDGQQTLIGLVSFVASIGCHVGLPAGFIRPGFYHSFLTTITDINFDW